MGKLWKQLQFGNEMDRSAAMDDSPYDGGISSAKDDDVSLILVQEGSLRTEGQKCSPTTVSIPSLVAGTKR
jgi:hypothetical protein